MNRTFPIYLDGREISAGDGQTLAAALMVNGIKVFRYSRRCNEPRGMFCGIGICNECAMIVDGMANVRTCVTYARPGMRLERQRPEKPRS